jgi:hypothetical protein
MSSKLHLPAIIEKQGSLSRNSKKRVYLGLIGGISVEGSSSPHARVLLEEAVMSICSNPCPYVQVSVDGAVHLATAGVARGTCEIKTFKGQGRSTTQVGENVTVDLEKGQNIDWILTQFVEAYDGAYRAMQKFDIT